VIAHPLALACFVAAAFCIVGVASACYAAVMQERGHEVIGSVFVIFLLSILALAFMVAGKQIVTGAWHGL
jgi:hypothetical protein